MTPQNEIRGLSQDEIIEMARQAASHGVENHRSGEVSFVFYNEHLMNFAKLVAAAAASKEREQIIAITETQEFSRMYGEFTPSAYDLVKAIRARGQQ